MQDRAIRLTMVKDFFGITASMTKNATDIPAGTRMKVFGERNTGTRALLQMLAGASHVRLVVPGNGPSVSRIADSPLRQQVKASYYDEWRRLYMEAILDDAYRQAGPLRAWKHSAPDWCQDYVTHQVQVIFLIRNPYSWALSMARRPYHMKALRTADFGEFLTRPWLTLDRDNVENVLPNVLELWNKKVQAYSDFVSSAQCFDMFPYVIPFEEFTADPAPTVRKALVHFGINTKGVASLRVSTKETQRSLADIQKFYRKELWKQRLTRESVGVINAHIDWDLAYRFGYHQLEATTFSEKLPVLEQRRMQYEMAKLDRPSEQTEFGSKRKTGAAPTA